MRLGTGSLDNGDVYIVPAFPVCSPVLAQRCANHRRTTRFSNRGRGRQFWKLAFQAMEVVEAMKKIPGVLSMLKVMAE